MNKRTKDILVAILAVTAGVAVYFGFFARSEKLNLDTYAVLGAVTAEETARLLDAKAQVLVLARGFGDNENPSGEAELKAFQKALKQHRGLSVVIEKVQATPMQMMATGGGLAADQLFKALANHANVGAVVLFMGFPPLADAELEALKKSKTKIIVVSALHPDYKRLLQRQAIHLAIVPRPANELPEARAALTLRERFDQEYMIITPAEATRMP